MKNVLIKGIVGITLLAPFIEFHVEIRALCDLTDKLPNHCLKELSWDADVTTKRTFFWWLHWRTIMTKMIWVIAQEIRRRCFSCDTDIYKCCAGDWCFQLITEEAHSICYLSRFSRPLNRWLLPVGNYGTAPFQCFLLTFHGLHVGSPPTPIQMINTIVHR